MKKFKRVLLIVFIITIVFLLTTLGYAIYRGLSNQQLIQTHESMCISNNPWKCKQIDMILYPKKTKEFKKINQKYEKNLKKLSNNEMLGYLKYNNKTYTITYGHTNGGFSINRADNLEEIIYGSCDLTFLGFGSNIKLTRLKYSNNFSNINKSKLILVEQK